MIRRFDSDHRRRPERRAAARAAFLAVAALAVALSPGAGGTAAFAQGDYPNRPIRLVVGYSTGGPTDILARLLGQEIGFFQVAGAAKGFFALIFAVLALMFAPAGAVHNSVLPITLLAVSLGLLCQSAAGFLDVPALVTVGSAVLIIASALALYMLVEKFYWLTLGRRVVPLGPAWIRRGDDPES